LRCQTFLGKIKGWFPLKNPSRNHLKMRKKTRTLTPFPLGKISLFLIFKKIGFQIDPLPPFRKSSLLKLFIFLMLPLPFLLSHRDLNCCWNISDFPHIPDYHFHLRLTPWYSSQDKLDYLNIFVLFW